MKKEIKKIYFKNKKLLLNKAIFIVLHPLSGKINTKFKLKSKGTIATTSSASWTFELGARSSIFITAFGTYNLITTHFYKIKKFV